MRFAATAIALVLASMPAAGVEVTVSATPIAEFMAAGLDARVNGLLWRGGVALTSPDDIFGGLSGMAFTSPDQHVSFVSDRGNFVSGQLAYDEAGRLFGLIGVSTQPIQNSRGDALPRQYSRDAEAIATVVRNGVPVAVRVGFENLTRVADFVMTDGLPGGAAREVAIPDWLGTARTNESLESVCIAPEASPIAGSTLLLTEGVMDADGQHRGWLLGQSDKGPVSYQASATVQPTDCAFLPNGDLLVLERGVAFLSFVMNLRRVPAAEVRAGNLMVGELLLEASGPSIDNMEMLAVHVAPNGEERIVIGSDNNFNDWQRTILLEFALPE